METIKYILNKATNLWKNFREGEAMYWINTISRILVLLAVVYMFFNLFIFKRSLDTDEASLKLNPVTSYTDKNGQKHSEIKTIQLTEDEFMKITDSISMNLKGRVVVKQVIIETTKTDTIFRNIPVLYDTMSGNFLISKKDDYINIEASGNVKEENGTIHIEIYDTITHADYVKKHFLKADERIVNISNKNPYISVTHGSSVVLKERKSLITFGPSVVYNPFTNRIGVGVGATFNIISIKSK